MRTYTIKPLVWRSTFEWMSIADTIIGIVSVTRTKNGWSITLPECFCNDIEETHFTSLEAAKLAAEEWYTKQIEQALTEQGE